MKAPLLTLSIISHSDSEKITALLNSLEKMEDTNRLQLILTDNLNHELSEFDASAWNSLQIIRNPKPLGFAQNHNQAFKRAEGEYFAILNPDLVFTEAVFEKLINKLSADQVDIIAPKIVDSQNVTQDSFRSLPTPLQLIKRRLSAEQTELFQADSRGLIHPDWIAGMFLLMKSETYRQLGGLDEKFFLYFEDVDFCTRARLNQLRLAVDVQTQVQHDAQHSSRKKLYYLFLHLQSAVRFFTSQTYKAARRIKQESDVSP